MLCGHPFFCVRQADGFVFCRRRKYTNQKQSFELHRRFGGRKGACDFMIFTQTKPPFWHAGDRAQSMKLDLLLCCALLLVPQVVRFGLRPLWLTLACAATAVLTEVLCSLILRREIAAGDLDSIVTGVLIAMLMPANIAFYAPAAAVIFAIAVAKMPFGGTGRTPFPPAAAGFAFAVLCFPDVIFSYADVLSGPMDWNIFRAATVTAAQSPTALLASGARPELLKPELMAGTIAGPIGTTMTFLTAATALYLFCRRTVSARIAICWMLAAGLMAGLFPRVSTGRADSVMIELSTGSLAFCAAFLATDPANAPKLPLSQCLYGFLGGLAAMLFRRWGVYEQGGCFAVLLICPAAIPLDRLVWRLTRPGKEAHTNEITVPLAPR